MNASIFQFVRLFATFNTSKRMRWFPRQGGTAEKGAKREETIMVDDINELVEVSDPFDVTQQSMLALQGKKLTGEPRMARATSGIRYMAPYYLPSRLQEGIMPVLLSDPWPTSGEAEQRRSHAELIVKFLRDKARNDGGQPISAKSLLEEINSHHGPTFTSESYVKAILEHLRVSRMIRASLNPKVSAAVAAGQANAKEGDPLIYYAPPHQKEEYGSPAAIAMRNRVKRRMEVELAYRRLRRSKPPYPIHRRISHDSAFHSELARLEVEKAERNFSDDISERKR